MSSATTTSSTSTSTPASVNLRIVLGGASGAGKTSLITRYVSDSFCPNNIGTVGIDFRVKMLHLGSGQLAKVQLWDTAGQDKYRFITANYWRGADGVVFVFDLTDLESFHRVESWAEEASKYGQSHMQRILVGSKADLGYKRAVSFEQAEQLARRLGMSYYEASSKNALGVSELFRSVIERAAASKPAPQPPLPALKEKKALFKFCTIL